MNRVLVTGASGYIGRHLISELLKEGFTVRGFARGSNPIGLTGIEWQRGNVCRLNEVKQAVRGCDAIVHLACLPINQSWDDPISDFNVNALGTFNVLQAARTVSVTKIVYTSTAQVYGCAKNLPVAEDDPTQPNSPYAASKLCGEILCTTCASCYELHTTVLRLFNVYGAAVDGRDRATVESIFLKQVTKKHAPVIKSHPEEGRDYVHIKDVVRAIRLALQAEAMGEIINVGTGTMTTLLQLAHMTIRLSGNELHPIIDCQTESRVQLQADTRKAQEFLGFEAERSLTEGLSQMLN